MVILDILSLEHIIFVLICAFKHNLYHDKYVASWIFQNPENNVVCKENNIMYFSTDPILYMIILKYLRIMDTLRL